MANIEGTNAYTAALNQLKKGAASPNEAQNSVGGGSFSDLVKESLSSAVEAQHTSEKVSAEALVGKADMTDVLQAITEAEVALNTVLAVRDKVVQAYQDIIRMPM